MARTYAKLVISVNRPLLINPLPPPPPPPVNQWVTVPYCSRGVLMFPKQRKAFFFFNRA